MFSQNVRFALRQLLRKPSFAIVAILSIGLGIGATTAVFSVIYAVAWHPFPYSGADRMVNVRLYDSTGDKGGLLLSGMQFLRFQKAEALDGAMAMDNWDMVTSDWGATEAVRAGRLSSNAFAYLGVPPLLGRGFEDADAVLGQEPNHVVVLGNRFWKSHYAGSTNVLGKILKLDHESYSIIGVMSKRFSWGSSDVYIPLKIVADPDRTNAVYSRLKPGITTVAAAGQLQSLVEQFAQELPQHFPRSFTVRVVGFIDEAVNEFSSTLLILLVAVSLLLLIGCVNVSILLLARGTSRSQEFALRTALGATRKQLMSQLLTESVALSVAGAVVGIAIAFVGIRLVLQWLPPDLLPSEVDVRINLPVLLFTLVVAAGTGLLFGLSPAARFSQPDLRQTLGEGGYRNTGSSLGKRTFTVLIVSQIAITVLLLACAGASLSTLRSLWATRLGYDPHNVTQIFIPLADGSYTKWGERVDYFEQIRKRVSQLPDVKAAALTAFALPPVSTYQSTVRIVGGSGTQEETVVLQQVSPEYFDTLRIPLLEGNIWTVAENMIPLHEAVINQAMARRFWPNRSPVGQTIQLAKLKAYTTWMIDSKGNDGTVQIVGVVGDTPNNGLRAPVLPAVYAPFTIVALDALELVVRSAESRASLISAVGGEVKAINPDQPLTEIRTAEEILTNEGWGRERFIFSLFLPFSMFAIALSAIGLFSVMSYVVSQRTREFGVRMALGATRVHILRTVLKPMGIAVAMGVVAGVVFSLWANRIVLHWTGANIGDPITLLLVTLLVFPVAACAVLMPAIRATFAQPTEVLRES
jgi:putative ABC transport system permease protein